MTTKPVGSNSGTSVWFRLAVALLVATFAAPAAQAQHTRVSTGPSRVLTTPLDLLEMTDIASRIFRGRVRSVELIHRSDDPATQLVKITFQVETWLKPRTNRDQEVVVWQHPSVSTQIRKDEDVLWFLGRESVEAGLIAPLGVTSGDFRIREEDGQTLTENLNGNASLWAGRLWKKVSMDSVRRSLEGSSVKPDRVAQLLELGKKDCSAQPMPYEFIAAIVAAHLNPMQQ